MTPSKGLRKLRDWGGWLHENEPSRCAGLSGSIPQVRHREAPLRAPWLPDPVSTQCPRPTATHSPPARPQTRSAEVLAVLSLPKDWVPKEAKRF